MILILIIFIISIIAAILAYKNEKKYLLIFSILLAIISFSISIYEHYSSKLKIVDQVVVERNFQIGEEFKQTFNLLFPSSVDLSKVVVHLHCPEKYRMDSLKIDDSGTLTLAGQMGIPNGDYQFIKLSFLTNYRMLEKNQCSFSV